MVNYVQTKWKLTPKAAEEAYRFWLQGLTVDGKIPIKDLQDMYDTAYATQLIPTPVPAAKVMDYALLDEVLRGRR
jgi:hypothetical protein